MVVFLLTTFEFNSSIYYTHWQFFINIIFNIPFYLFFLFLFFRSIIYPPSTCILIFNFYSTNWLSSSIFFSIYLIFQSFLFIHLSMKQRSNYVSHPFLISRNVFRSSYWKLSPLSSKTYELLSCIFPSLPPI